MPGPKWLTEEIKAARDTLDRMEEWEREAILKEVARTQYSGENEPSPVASEAREATSEKK